MEAATKVTIKSIVERARNLIQAIGEDLEKLYNLDKATYSKGGALGARYAVLKTFFNESKARMDKPCFSIATLGTTSSGKSTLVNAIIGHQLAPMESAEMSSGVLTFNHSEQSPLLDILNTDGATWKCGIKKDLKDKDIYDILFAMMREYHKITKTKEISAPIAHITLPLLPVKWKELLQLPDDMGFELIDLPGLRYANDDKNLKIIKNLVKKAFSLVVLDYSQTDETNRAQLLKELKSIVFDFAGKTDCMLFILNKVDLRTSVDDPLEERLNKLGEEIKRELNLKSLPIIIPTSALPLNYIQCAWGLNPEKATIDKDIQTYYLQCLFDDCAKTLRINSKKDEKARELIDRMIAIIDKGGCDIEENDLKELLKKIYLWSGGFEFWRHLHARLLLKFSSLVIYPSVITLINNIDEFDETIVEVLEIRRNNSVNEIRELKEQLDNDIVAIHREIEKMRRDFPEKAREAGTYLKEGKPESTNKAAELLGEGFRSLTLLVRTIEQDITGHIIDPIRTSLKNKGYAYDIKDSLKPFIPPNLLEAICRKYEKIRDIYNDDNVIGYGRTLEAKEGNIDEIQKLSDCQKAILDFNYKVKLSIIARAKYVLRSKSNEFCEATTAILNTIANDLQKLATSRFKVPEKINKLIPGLKTFGSDIAKDIDIPEDLFVIKETSTIEDLNRTERIGSHNITVKTGSCSNEIKTIDDYGSFSYKTYKVPSVVELAEGWLQGIKSAYPGIWQKMVDWLIDSVFESASLLLIEKLKETEIIFKRVYEEQEKALQEDLKTRLEKIKEIEQQKNVLMKNVAALKELATSEGNGR